MAMGRTAIALGCRAAVSDVTRLEGELLECLIVGPCPVQAVPASRRTRCVSVSILVPFAHVKRAQTRPLACFLVRAEGQWTTSLLPTKDKCLSLPRLVGLVILRGANPSSHV